MSESKVFSFLIICALISFSVWYFAPYFEYTFLSEEALALRALDGFESRIVYNAFGYKAIFVIWVLLFLFLLFRVKRSKELFVVANVVFVLILPVFYGIRISSQLDEVTSTVFTLCCGGIIALSYCSEVKESFNK